MLSVIPTHFPALFRICAAWEKGMENLTRELRGSPLPKGIARGRLARVCKNVLGVTLRR